MTRLCHLVEFALFGICRILVGALPLAAVRCAGILLGDLVWWVDRRHRRTALSNVALVHPELGPAARRRIARFSFRTLGGAACDTLHAMAEADEPLRARMRLEGGENLRRALAGGRGAFVLSAHLGRWEMGALAVSAAIGPVHPVVRPLDNPLLDGALRRFRERFGNRVISKRGAVRRVIEVIRAGGMVGFLIDQYPKPGDGIPTLFLGQTSRTNAVLARLSLRTGAPVVPLFTYPEGTAFRTILGEPIVPSGAGEEAIADLTRRYLEVIEAQIRHRPEQWLWMHRRWRATDLETRAPAGGHETGAGGSATPALCGTRPSGNVTARIEAHRSGPDPGVASGAQSRP